MLGHQNDDPIEKETEIKITALIKQLLLLALLSFLCPQTAHSEIQSPDADKPLLSNTKLGFGRYVINVGSVVPATDTDHATRFKNISHLSPPTAYWPSSDVISKNHGINIEVFQARLEVILPDSGGVAEFLLPAGNYSLRVIPPAGYHQHSRTFSVQDGEVREIRGAPTPVDLGIKKKGSSPNRVGNRKATLTF